MKINRQIQTRYVERCCPTDLTRSIRRKRCNERVLITVITGKRTCRELAYKTGMSTRKSGVDEGARTVIEA